MPRIDPKTIEDRKSYDRLTLREFAGVQPLGTKTAKHLKG